MKAKHLMEDWKKLDPEMEVVISQPFVIDEKEGFWGVLDLPVVGVAVNKEGNEVRFLLDKEAVMKSFPPEMLKQVKFFEDPKTKTVTFGKPQIAKAVRDSRIKNGKRKSKK